MLSLYSLRNYCVSTAQHKQKLLLILSSIVLIIFDVIALMTPMASAAQITGRTLTLGSSAASAATTYAFTFTVPTTGTIIKSFSADICTTASGTCTTPSGFSNSSSTLSSQPTGMGDTS